MANCTAYRLSPTAPADGRRFHLTGWLAIVVIVGFGCDNPATISRYQVPHESRSTTELMPGAPGPSAVAKNIPQRMLGTILPIEGKAWFFKAMGPTEKIKAIETDFRNWQDSVTFDDTKNPVWKLPAGWSQEAGNQFRYATLRAPNGQDISITILPIASDTSFDDYLASNVNRWRDQLGLGPVSAEQLSTTSQPIVIAEQPAIFVDLAGEAPAGNPMRSAPFANGPNSSPGSTVSPAGQATATSQSETQSSPPSKDQGESASEPRMRTVKGLGFEIPAGWTEGRGSAFRLATLNVSRGNQKAETTLIYLGSQSGSLLDNVNRWRGQIELGAISQDDLQSSLESLDVGGETGKYVRLFTTDASTEEPTEGDALLPRQAILATIFSFPDRTLFVKMLGDSELVETEEPNFRRLVQSLKFP